MYIRYFSLALGVVIVAGFTVSTAHAEKGKRCTKTSTSCYDTVNKKARTCISETCTFADGTSTTSTTVELVNGGGSPGQRKPKLQTAPLTGGVKQ